MAILSLPLPLLRIIRPSSEITLRQFVVALFQSLSTCLFPGLLLLSPLSPSAFPLFPLYQHFLYNTHHVLLFHSFSVSTRYRELEKAHIVIFLSFVARLRHPHSDPSILGISHPSLSRSYLRTFPRWLIIQLLSHFPFFWSLTSLPGLSIPALVNICLLSGAYRSFFVFRSSPSPIRQDMFLYSS